MINIVVLCDVKIYKNGKVDLLQLKESHGLPQIQNCSLSNGSIQGFDTYRYFVHVLQYLAECINFDLHLSRELIERVAAAASVMIFSYLMGSISTWKVTGKVSQEIQW